MIKYIAIADTRRTLYTDFSVNNVPKAFNSTPPNPPPQDIQLHQPITNAFEPLTMQPLSNQNTESTATNTMTTMKCKPVENIIFLKTHKTGSSTIINIIQRYAQTNKLKVALPNIEHYLGWPNTFREKYIFEHSHGDKYNILCNHARFHKERMMNIMESKKARIVTIIRDPLYQFESAAVYFDYYDLFKINRKLNLVDAFFNKSRTEICNRTKISNSPVAFLVKNPVTYDLGFPTWKDNETLVNNILRKVKEDFHLVMISDYMAESLIMLKNELCLDFKDIVYFTKNRRADRLRQQIRNITTARIHVKGWNNIDYRIFEYYNATFWKKVREGGTKFQEDVKTLKDKNKWLRKMCPHSRRHFDNAQSLFPILGSKSKKESKTFNLRSFCENMFRSEIDYTNLLKLKYTKFNWRIPRVQTKKKEVKESKSKQFSCESKTARND